MAVRTSHGRFGLRRTRLGVSLTEPDGVSWARELHFTTALPAKTRPPA